MGNTKQIYFECSIPLNQEFENPFFSTEIKKLLLTAAHGDHCSIEVYRDGYLGLNDQQMRSGAPREAFIIGSVTSRSMRAYDLVSLFEEFAVNFEVIIRDVDGDALHVYHRCNGEKSYLEHGLTNTGRLL